jgi:hypothetical protein
MSDTISDLIALDNMATDNKSILSFPISSNFKRGNTGKNGWGEIIIAIPNDVIINLTKYIGALYLADQNEFEKYKNAEPEPETTTIKQEDCFLVCQKCRSIVPPQLEKFHFYFCPSCGKRIEVAE